MSLAAPLALVGLVALPLLWWWHRRTREPRPLVVASLLFFLAPAGSGAPRRRRGLDAALLLACLGAGALAVAAAGPSSTPAAVGQRVRVIVEAGPLAALDVYAAAVERALERVRADLGPDDRLDVLAWPPAGSPAAAPEPAVLEAVARAAPADARHVIARAAPAEPAPGVRWWPLDLEAVAGGPLPSVGIVAVGVDRDEAGALRVQVTVEASAAAAAPTPIVVALRVVGEERDRAVARAALDPQGAVGLVLAPGALEADAVLEVALTTSAADALGADDRVRLERRAPGVHIADGVPPATRADLLSAVAAGGRARLVAAPREAEVRIVPRAPDGEGVPGVFTLVVPAGGAPASERVPPTATRVRVADPLVRDLAPPRDGVRIDLDGVAASEGAPLLLGWKEGARTWPVVRRRGSTAWLLALPAAGRPALRTTPFLPLLLDNLLDLVAGPDAGEGWRARGLLSATTTRLVPPPPGTGPVGRTGGPTPPATGPARPWRRALLATGLLALAVLWLGPLRSRLTGRLRRPRAPRR